MWPADALEAHALRRSDSGALSADASANRLSKLSRPLTHFGWRSASYGPTVGDLFARHLGHARVEDRIRCGKDTGLRSFPFRQIAANQVCLELMLAAQELRTFFQRLCLDGEARPLEPKTLRHPAAWPAAGGACSPACSVRGDGRRYSPPPFGGYFPFPLQPATRGEQEQAPVRHQSLLPATTAFRVISTRPGAYCTNRGQLSPDGHYMLGGW